MAGIKQRLIALERRSIMKVAPALTLVFTWRTPEERISAEAAVMEHRKHENAPRLPGQGILKYESKEFGT